MEQKIKTPADGLCPKCFYFDGDRNFGDLLNIALFDALFLRWDYAARQDAAYIAIGSLLDDLVFKGKPLKKLKLVAQLFKKRDVYILGSGFIKPPKRPTEQYVRKIIPVGVRGKISRERLARNGVDCSGAVLGDWGLLADKLIPTPSVAPRYDVGVIPHYVDKDAPFIREIGRRPSVKIIDVQQEPAAFVADVLACRTILSSALHGLIAADCYGIPNLALKLSDKVVGGRYKFDDYYSVFDIAPDFLTPDDIGRISDIQEYIRAHYRIDAR